jgi:ATP-dependent RNA helicase DDX18/HAS1
MAFQSVFQGKSCIIADQSGSGKTLAYLCPIIQRLRQDEEAALAQAKSPISENSSRCPRVIVLAPTAELASQVLHNCRLISKSGIPFRSMVATGGFKQRTQLETLDQGLDVLVATPGRFLYLYQQGFVQLSHLHWYS